MDESLNQNKLYEVVGSSPLRADAWDKVRGNGVYIEDMKFSGLIYGKVLRSSYAHAKLIHIDISEAEKLPGVKGIVTGQDLPFLHGESCPDEPFLARSKVRYVGEAVAAVAAIDEETAERALALIKVKYEELPSLLDPESAAKPGAILIHEETYNHKPLVKPVIGTNICNQVQFDIGDVERGFEESDYIFEDTFTTPAQQHCSIEPHGSVCQINHDNNLTLWTNNDSPYRARIEIANSLHLPLTKVRVISAPYTGGNFGGKGGLRAEALAIALAWKIRNVPIMVMYNREEEFCSSLVRHPSVTKMKTGVKKDGTIVARQVTTYLATGAYAEKGPSVSLFGGMSAAGPYKIPNVKIDVYLMYTNTLLAGAMRGYSGPQLSWAYESQMDIIAAKLGIDPLEMRLRHAYEDGDTHTTTRQILHAEGLKECLQEVAKSMAWGEKTLGKDQGRGIACMERAVKTPFGSAAFVKVNEDGTVDVLSSTTEVGQGSETIIRQIVAEELGVLLESVRKHTPDTAFTPYDASTTSSRSTFHMGNAVKMAASDARQQVLQLGAKVLGVEPLNLEIKRGIIVVKGKPEVALPISTVFSKSYSSSGTILGRGYYIPEMPDDKKEDFYSAYCVFWLLGANGVEVEVDRKTGQVKILKIYAAHDSGKAIHPENVADQIVGGVSMGVGFAAYEDYAFKDGHVLNPSFLYYKLPSALDIPDIVPIVVEKEHREGPFGAKGVGETTNVPVPPALANAIYDAVGIRIKSLPITPDKVLAALKLQVGGDK